MFGNSVWHYIYKFRIYFDEELASFGYVVGVFLPPKFELISENFKLVSQRK